MPLAQIVLILSLVLFSAAFLTWAAYTHRISAALTFIWYILCLVLAGAVFRYDYVVKLSLFFHATPSILILTIVVFWLIIFLFYQLMKINMLFRQNKILIQEIALLRAEKSGSQPEP
jgi:hypothetical protein